MSTITPEAILSNKAPIEPKQFNERQPRTTRLYPLSNYTFDTKEHQPEEGSSVMARLKRLEEHYAAHGMCRTCVGILTLCPAYHRANLIIESNWDGIDSDDDTEHEAGGDVCFAQDDGRFDSLFSGLKILLSR